MYVRAHTRIAGRCNTHQVVSRQQQLFSCGWAALTPVEPHAQRERKRWKKKRACTSIIAPCKPGSCFDFHTNHPPPLPKPDPGLRRVAPRRRGPVQSQHHHREYRSGRGQAGNKTKKTRTTPAGGSLVDLDTAAVLQQGINTMTLPQKRGPWVTWLVG